MPLLAPLVRVGSVFVTGLGEKEISLPSIHMASSNGSVINGGVRLPALEYGVGVEQSTPPNSFGFINQAGSALVSQGGVR